MTGSPVSPAWPGLIEAYRSRLPVSDSTPVITLQEGATPLLPAYELSRRTGCEVFLKVDGANPTASFKDRGMTMAVTDALARGQQGDRVARMRRTARQVMDNFTGKHRRYERLAGERGTNGKEELRLRRMFQHIPTSARFQRASRVRGILVHRQEHNPYVRIVALQQHERVDPVQVRHGDVGDDDIRPKARRSLHELAPILHDPHQLELLLEQPLDAFGHHSMVVGQQNARATHDAAPPSGTHADIVVPCPDALLMPRRPPSSLTLSPMLAYPRLGRDRVASTSNPMPSSVTASNSPPSLSARVTLATLAFACRATLRSASCATRNMHNATSLGSLSGTWCTSTSTRTD